MPEKVTVREDLQVIVVESYGDVSADDLRASLRTVAEIRQARGFDRVFVDARRETSIPSTLSIFEFGSELAEVLRGTKLALVTSPKTDRDLKFLATVASNRGAQVHLFDSEAAALAWLLEKPGKAGAGDDT